MKVSPRFAIALLTIPIGIIAALSWSAHVGRKVWSPRVFAWRNFFKPQPNIEVQANCPVRLEHPRFYSFMSIGSSIGSVLKLDVKNASDKPIHSFTISYHSLEPTDTGSIGVHPEAILQPEQYQSIGVSSNGSVRITFSVDFVQFADGDVWCVDPPGATVKPAGVSAGAQAAHEYLVKTLAAEGVAAVIDVLPQIRLYVGEWDLSKGEVHGYFGFTCGITNTVVRVEQAYREGGLSEVEEFLKRRT